MRILLICKDCDDLFPTLVTRRSPSPLSYQIHLSQPMKTDAVNQPALTAHTTDARRLRPTLRLRRWRFLPPALAVPLRLRHYLPPPARLRAHLLPQLLRLRARPPAGAPADCRTRHSTRSRQPGSSLSRRTQCQEALRVLPASSSPVSRQYQYRLRSAFRQSRLPARDRSARKR